MLNLTFVFKCLHSIALYLFKSYFITYSHIYSSRRNGLDISIPKSVQNLQREEHFILEPTAGFQ